MGLEGLGTISLVLTVVGERLELARLRAHGQVALAAFGMAVAAYVGALLLMVLDEGLGMRLSGAGMVALALWLLRYDMALMTVRREGLPRFVAVCLLAGYVWLGIGGAWFEYEHTAAGVDFGTGFGQRLDWLDEAVSGMSTLLAGETVHADLQGVCAGMNNIIAKLPATLPNSHVISSAGCSQRNQ